MTTAAQPRPHTTPAKDVRAPQQMADVFVIFGITGDLAKVMTFNSLYRLEARGLLTCPIVGVAVSDWSDDDLRSHAREAIVELRHRHRRGGVRSPGRADVVRQR